MDRSGARRRSRVVLILRQLPRASRRLTFATAGCVLVGGALPSAFILSSGAAIGAVPEAINDGFSSPAGRRLVGALVAIGALFVLQQTLAPVREALTGMLARRLRGSIYRRTMLATLAPATVAHLEDPALHDHIARATGTSQPGPAAVVRAMVGSWSDTLSGIFGIVLLAQFRWWLALLLLVALLVQARRRRDANEQRSAARSAAEPKLRRAGYFAQLALTPPAAKEIRLFGLDGWVTDRFETSWREGMAPVWRRRGGSWRGVLAWSLPSVVVQAVALVMIGHAAVDGQIGLGALVVFAQAVLASRFLGSPGEHDLYLERGAQIVGAVAAVERMVEQTPGLRLGGTRGSNGLPHHQLRFEDVSFRYPGQHADVLHGVNLEVSAGRSLAIVGLNGAGKTTLVKLLARLYDPTAGRITVDDIDLVDLDPHEWQRRIAAVFQDFVRYPLSARENVGFGAVERLGDLNALEKAARRARAAELIESLPQGWSTMLDRTFEGGVDLSGGQWQRIALARALLAADSGAGVLILDEPTAQLDAPAEADFYDRFLELTAGHTTVVISHRFSTVRRADRIIVLADGRAAEDGTHNELIAAGGRYAALFSLQAARYAEEPAADG